MMERARFCLTNLKVRRLIKKASRSDVMRSSSKTTSLTSNATSEPLPIAMAISLLERAKRRNEIFMPVNCYSFSDTLIESELYGHEDGAFTGSNGLRIGRFEATNNGTLFLDEVGDLPESTQIKILRNIETRQITRIGSNMPIQTDNPVRGAHHHM